MGRQDRNDRKFVVGYRFRGVEVPLRFLIFILLSVALDLPAFAASPLEGTYWGPKKDGKIQIVETNGVFAGKLIWVLKPGVDSKNPDEKLRARDLVGIALFDGFHHDSDLKWKGGTIYDPESGKTYDCKLWFEDGDLSKLKARGFIGLSILGRTETFERVADETKKEEPKSGL